MSEPKMADLCAKQKVGTIAIKNAHIWFHRPYFSDQPRAYLIILPFGEPFPRTVKLDGQDVRFSNIGACMSSWATDHERKLLNELRELLIELSLAGGDMKQMLPEMMKIREFAALGSESMNMARAFSEVIHGSAYEDLEFWARYKN
jgi:hypothetical protein